jgi:hypothetical protein
MIYPLIIVCCAIGIVIINRSWIDDLADTILHILLGVLFGIVISLFVGVIASFVFDTKMKLSSTKEIYALEDNITTSGEFFLGTGYVDGNMEYFYVVKDGKGKRIDSIEANKVTIVDHEGKPHIKVYEPRFKSKFVASLFDVPFALDNYYEFYIPKGTIKQNYNIDLK